MANLLVMKRQLAENLLLVELQLGQNIFVFDFVKDLSLRNGLGRVQFLFGGGRKTG